MKLLELSLLHYKLQYHLYGVLSLGSWVRNCSIKPIVIRRALDAYKQPLVFVDADAVVMQEPSLFGVLDCDVAAHVRPNGELLSGTLYFNTTKAAKNLLNKWIYEQSLNSDEWDQRVLQRVLEKDKEVRFYNLPQSYTKIFDAIGPEAVIQHNQASRRYKHMTGLYPKELGARLMNDGTFILPRANTKLVTEINRNYAPVPGSEKRWHTKLDTEIDVQIISLNTDTAYLIGKGPSLDNISCGDFEEPYPIFCMNESVHKIVELELDQDVYTLQQDSTLEDKCYNPKAKLLLNRHAICSKNEDKFYKLYTPETYGCASNTLTVVMAIKLLKDLGIRNFIMLGFDASMTKNIAYADCIGYTSSKAGDPKRFLTHRPLIYQAVGDCDIEFRELASSPFIPIN